MQFKGKLVNQAQEKGEKPNFGPNFGPRMFLVGFTSTRYSTLSQAIIVCNFQKVQTQENGEKPHFVPDLGSLGPNSGCQNSFSNIWLRQSLDIMVSYHHVQYQKQLMIQS